jgi:hypothetical protein
MTPEIENDPQHTAIHKAGHVVIARVLTLACGGATIVPNYEHGAAGHSITEDPWQCVHEWEKRGKVRDNSRFSRCSQAKYLFAVWDCIFETHVELRSRPGWHARATVAADAGTHSASVWVWKSADESSGLMRGGHL